jgi:hypothetical protein
MLFAAFDPGPAFFRSLFSPCGAVLLSVVNLDKPTSGAKHAAEKLARAVDQGFIPGTSATESTRALQAAEKLVRAVGQGFIPGIRSTESTRALAPEVRPSSILPEYRTFSAACLAPEGRFSAIWTFTTGY